VRYTGKYIEWRSVDAAGFYPGDVVRFLADPFLKSRLSKGLLAIPAGSQTIWS
jgi:hypothetical protein